MTQYTKTGLMTSPGRYAEAFSRLPRDLPGLTRAIQGLQIHEYFLTSYGVAASDTRKRESQLRRLEHMLGALIRLRADPLEVARQPVERLIGVCRHYSVWLVAALQQQGIPARARWGFGTYFNAGSYEDHIVGEYWNADQKRWVLVDAQLDAHQRQHLKVDFDPLDVPRDRFIGAHAAWQRCRSGELNPGRFGISVVPLHGLWFVAASLVRDVAALNGMEPLPWDVWGAMPKIDAALTSEELAFFDQLAKLTAAPDEHGRELSALWETDPRVRPNGTVWNDRTQKHESIDALPPA